MKLSRYFWENIAVDNGIITNNNHFPVVIRTKHQSEFVLYGHEKYEMKNTVSDSYIFSDILDGRFRATIWDGIYA